MLPALREHHAEFLLKELYKRWGNHKIMVRWLSRFFNYLDRCARARTACRLANAPPCQLWHRGLDGASAAQCYLSHSWNL